ncbi:MAG: Aminotransferase [Candidatus Magasanikbacteria bacterium GW2011_GWC2_41_17]|uniref:Aminotransferase n=2 Tax=Candidatus Magasanikiibacteriota TaxID=1752731 RepID=A0A0G0YVF1_9BACT|nr:MAG: Aminotransferase [Candidatus Magasanikbacteria bacterium GW2011_GWC2_41_17]KKS13641.1 MAG: Aminotransferase [Candidatus Magasanikbacteria bacterium GW2011_GWA2_41_55]
MRKKLPISRPLIQKDDVSAVAAVLKTGRLSFGPKHIEFEKLFAKKIGTRFAVAVSSGTAGLHLTMVAAGIGSGDEVITSPFSFVASANCILYVGAKPVFADVDIQTGNIDPKKIEERITKKTKAILVVHIFGQSADMDPILKIAKKHKLKIIEDACESVMAEYNGKRVGTFGESAVFAFYPNKQMTTGEGGMITTNSERIYKMCKSLANQGRSDNMQWLDHQCLGYNYRLDEMSAALGLTQLKKLDFMISKRRQVADWYSEFFKKYGVLVATPKIARWNTHTWFVYVVRIINNRVIRDKVIKKLAQKGISSKPYLPSIHLFDFYKKRFGYKMGAYPVSEKISRMSLALPFYIGLKKEDVKYICEQLINILKNYEK